MLAATLLSALPQVGTPPTLSAHLDAGAPGAHLSARCGPPIPGRTFCLGVHGGAPGQLGWLGLGPLEVALSVPGISGTVFLGGFTDSAVFALDPKGVSDDLLVTPPLDVAFLGAQVVAQGATLGPTLDLELTNGLRLQVGEPGGTPFEGLPVANLDGKAWDEHVVGDFNGDGFGDVVSYLYRVNDDLTFAVHHGRPDGTLELVQSPTTTDCDHRSGLTAADFTGDGRLDIALGCAWKNELKIYAGLPSGLFGLNATVAVIGDMRQDESDVAGAQLDGNAFGDFAVALRDAYEVEVHLNPLGPNPSVFTVPTLDRPSIVEFADLNGDGWQDLIVGSENAFAGATSTVGVHLNTGANGFGPLQYVAVLPSGSDSITRVEAGDVNDDGFVDLATSFRYALGATIALGHGDGSFAAPIELTLDEPCRSIVVEDVDGDGVVDVLAVGRDTREPFLWIHAGGGSFAPGGPIHPFGPAPTQPAVHDMNLDGSPDIVFASFNGYAAVIHADAPGAFPFPDQRFVGNNPSQQIATDMNADGWNDLVTVTVNFVGAWYGMNVRLGLPNGGYTVAEYGTMATQSPMLAAGDFNGDGYPDLAHFADELPASYERIEVRLGNGDGTTTPWTSISTSNSIARFIAVLDADQDGNLDVAWSGTGSSEPVRIRLGLGTGSFGAPVSVLKDISTGTLGTVYDIDGDGDDDLILGNFDDVQVLLNEPRGVPGMLTAQPSLMSTGTALPCGSLFYNIQSVSAGDLNGDGLADLALAVHADCSSSDSGLAIALATGPGVFAPATMIESVAQDGRQVELADVNFDGHLDAVYATAGTLEIFLGLGDGTFEPGQAYLSGGGAGDLVLTDFDHDGSPDLGLTNDANDWVTRIINRVGDQ